MTTPKPVQTESEVRTKPSGVEGHAGGIAAPTVQAGRSNGEHCDPTRKSCSSLPRRRPGKRMTAVPAARELIAPLYPPQPLSSSASASSVLPTLSRVRPPDIFWYHADRRPLLRGQRLWIYFWKLCELWREQRENVWASVIVLGVWWFAWLCAGYL